MKTKPLFLLLLSCAISAYNFGQNVGEPAPDFSLNTLADTNFQLSEQRNKVVMLFFFGNSCPHCLAGGPTVQSELVEEFNANPNFIAVGIDTWDGNKAAVESFKNSTGLNIIFCREGSGTGADYNTTYDRLVVVDGLGKIKFKGTENAAQTIEPAKSAIENSLAALSTSNFNVILNDEKLKMFPNPSTPGEITIQYNLESATAFKINISSTDGKLLKYVNMGKVSAGSIYYKLNTSEFSTGIYIVSIITENIIVSESFVVH